MCIHIYLFLLSLCSWHEHIFFCLSQQLTAHGCGIGEVPPQEVVGTSSCVLCLSPHRFFFSFRCNFATRCVREYLCVYVCLSVRCYTYKWGDSLCSGLLTAFTAHPPGKPLLRDGPSHIYRFYFIFCSFFSMCHCSLYIKF